MQKGGSCLITHITGADLTLFIMSEGSVLHTNVTRAPHVETYPCSMSSQNVFFLNFIKNYYYLIIKFYYFIALKIKWMHRILHMKHCTKKRLQKWQFSERRLLSPLWINDKPAPVLQYLGTARCRVADGFGWQHSWMRANVQSEWPDCWQTSLFLVS